MIALLEGAMREPVERRLTAILAADVVAYSRLMGADEEGTLERLKSIRHQLFDPKIKAHRGRIVKTTGDGILAEFPSVLDAVRCAVELQRAMVDRNAESPRTSGSSSASGSILATLSSTATTSTATASTSRRGWRHWRSRAASASRG